MAKRFGETAAARYVIRQQPEPVVEISLDIAPVGCRGYRLGHRHLHLELSAEPTRLSCRGRTGGAAVYSSA